MSFEFYFCVKQKMESREFFGSSSSHLGPLSIGKFFCVSTGDVGDVVSFEFYFCVKQKLESREFFGSSSSHLGPLSIGKFF